MFCGGAFGEKISPSPFPLPLGEGTGEQDRQTVLSRQRRDISREIPEVAMAGQTKDRDGRGATTAPAVVVCNKENLPEALTECTVVFSPAGKMALFLADCQDALIAKHGRLFGSDVDMLLEIYQRMGLPDVLIQWLLGKYL